MSRPLSTLSEVRILAAAVRRLKYREIAAETGIPIGTIGCAMRRLIRDGWVEGRRGQTNELFSLGLTTTVLKNPENEAAEASYAPPSTGERRCGARRASDLKPGTGVNGSVRAVTFGRDVIDC